MIISSSKYTRLHILLIAIGIYLFIFSISSFRSAQHRLHTLEFFNLQPTKEWPYRPPDGSFECLGGRREYYKYTCSLAHHVSDFYLLPLIYRALDPILVGSDIIRLRRYIGTKDFTYMFKQAATAVATSPYIDIPILYFLLSAGAKLRFKITPEE